MDEHTYFWCHPGILCLHGSHECFLECAYITFGFWIYDLTENTNYNTMKRFEAFNQWRIRRRNLLLQRSTTREQFLVLRLPKLRSDWERLLWLLFKCSATCKGEGGYIELFNTWGVRTFSNGYYFGRSERIRTRVFNLSSLSYQLTQKKAS